MKYYILIDKINDGDIIRLDSGKYYKDVYGTKDSWIRTSIMIRYTWPEDELYDLYKEINEREAAEQIEKQQQMLDKLLILAGKVATEAHAGQVDKGGNPYILHPKAVASGLSAIEYKVVALLHDVLEDINITAQDLQKMGFTNRIVNSVSILTKKPNEAYTDYLRRIKSDSVAWHVKIADLQHNLDITRIPNPSPEDYERLNKYKDALFFLES